MKIQQAKQERSSSEKISEGKTTEEHVEDTKHSK